MRGCTEWSSSTHQGTGNGGNVARIYIPGHLSSKTRGTAGHAINTVCLFKDLGFLRNNQTLCVFLRANVAWGRHSPRGYYVKAMVATAIPDTKTRLPLLKLGCTAGTSEHFFVVAFRYLSLALFELSLRKHSPLHAHFKIPDCAFAP